MAVQASPGQARPVQARKETPLSSVPNFLTPTRTHIKKRVAATGPRMERLTPMIRAGKTFFFFYIRVVKPLTLLVLRQSEGTEGGLVRRVEMLLGAVKQHQALLISERSY